MKEVKSRMIKEIVMLVIGIIGLVVSIIYNNSFGIGFSSSLLGIAIYWLSVLSKVSKSETKSKDFLALEKDERLKLINNESRSTSFTIIIFILLTEGVVGYIIDNQIIMLLSTITALVGSIIYIVIYTILNKKR